MTNEGDLLKPPKSLQPPLRYEIPDDPVGTRPPGHAPQGPLVVLRATVALVLYHHGRLLWITFVVGVIGLGATALVGFPAGYLAKGSVFWAPYLTAPLLWLFQVPLMAGYLYAVLLVIQGVPAKAREVLRPLRHRSLYFHVLAAGVLPVAGSWATAQVGRLLSPLLPAALLPGHPHIEQFVRGLPLILVTAAFLPFGFAALDAVTAKGHFGDAIRRSLRFARRYWRLFGTYGLMVVASLAAVRGARAFLRWFGDLRDESGVASLGYAGLYLLAGMGILAAAVVWAVFLSTFQARCYCEFVWREREAGGRADGTAGEAGAA